MPDFANNVQLVDFLEAKVIEYNQSSFIAADPVSVPHRFSSKQNIEIAGLFASVFSWGNRTTIIRKSNELMSLMDDAPYDFILGHKPRDLKKLAAFKHRTYNTEDLFYFIRFLKSHYKKFDSLETAFQPLSSMDKEKTGTMEADGNVENEHAKIALSSFYNNFFSLKDAPWRTRKHISTPEKNSTCKRLNMYLRWMVRTDKNGVDFGIWKRIRAADLICPVDLHVARVARRFGLIKRTQTDWITATELTLALRQMDPKDPVKYDFALFGLGIMEKY